MLQRIQLLAVQGLPPPRIVEVLEREFDPAAVPDVRTVRNHATRMLERLELVEAAARRRGDDAPWTPRPPEPVPSARAGAGPARASADRAVLDVLAGAVPRGVAWPDRTTARWWGWVRELAPDLPAEDVPDLAALWRARHARGEPTRDLTLFVAGSPWRGSEAFQRYLTALVETGEPPYVWWAGFPAVAGAWVAAHAVVLAWLLGASWRLHDTVRRLDLDLDRDHAPQAAEAAETARMEAAAWGARTAPWCDRLRAELIVLHGGTWAARRGGGGGAAGAPDAGPGVPPPPQAPRDAPPGSEPGRRNARWVERMSNLNSASVALLWTLRSLEDWLVQGLPPARRLMETWGEPSARAPLPGPEPAAEFPQALTDADWGRLSDLIQALTKQTPLPIHGGAEAEP
jgi:hypothetical protein